MARTSRLSQERKDISSYEDLREPPRFDERMVLPICQQYDSREHHVYRRRE